jgi:hypothetical protein
LQEACRERAGKLWWEKLLVAVGIVLQDRGDAR